MSTTQPDIQISSIKTASSTLDYAIIKGGPKSFVLLPGLYTKSLMPLAPAVAMQYRRFLGEYTIIMFDRVSEPPAHYTVKEMATDTIRAMDALHIRDAYMMGVSAGGMVAQAIAAERPDLVKRLVIGSSTPAMTEHARGILNNWSALAKAGKADELGRSFAEMIYTDAFYVRHKEAILASLSGTTDVELKRFSIFADGLCSFDLTANLHAINCPVLAIGGALDRIFPPKQAMEIARNTGGRFFIFDNYGHAVYDEAADYLDKVWEFFEEERKE
ncbi:MAG: alpha/beta fold hydrolase [Victivallales bacterium]|nr:alpha/beta fold hydrolase [Victivallales bacterium]